jgi:hypothetical protein
MATRALLHKHDFDSPALPRNIGYLELIWLRLYDERELVRTLARSALLDKLAASQVHSTTSANEELTPTPTPLCISEDNGTALTE